MTENGAYVERDPKEAARLCADRWDGLDLDAICKALADAEAALDLLIGADDA